MTHAEPITRGEFRAMLETCCATGCTRRSDVVATFRIPLGPDRPAAIAIASFCRRDYDPTDQPSYAELLHTADSNPGVPLYRDLLDCWPRPIAIQHEDDGAR